MLVLQRGRTSSACVTEEGTSSVCVTEEGTIT